MNDASNVPVTLIFGATGGIGTELAGRLAKAGSRLVLAGRSREALERLAQETGGLPIVADATIPADVDAAVSKTMDAYGHVGGVAHCVGSLLLKPAHLTSEEEWSATIATNLTSAFHVVRAATRAMQRTGGSIVLVSSAAASVGLANHEAIAAAKGGVAALAISAAATYASRGIRVNCVAPGLVRTPLTARLTENESTLRGSTAMHPVGRIGEPRDVAAVIAFLLDPANTWITGQVIGVDGGLAALRTPAGRPASGNAIQVSSQAGR